MKFKLVYFFNEEQIMNKKPCLMSTVEFHISTGVHPDDQNLGGLHTGEPSLILQGVPLQTIENEAKCTKVFFNYYILL